MEQKRKPDKGYCHPNSCEVKYRYNTKALAKLAVLKKRIRKRRVHYYFCTWCKGWHITGHGRWEN